MQAIHNSVQHFCQFREYTASMKINFQEQVQSIHNGVKYSCKFCENKASTKGNLHCHVQSVHNGFKYSCEYKASFKGDHHEHI